MTQAVHRAVMAKTFCCSVQSSGPGIRCGRHIWTQIDNIVSTHQLHVRQPGDSSYRGENVVLSHEKCISCQKLGVHVKCILYRIVDAKFTCRDATRSTTELCRARNQSLLQLISRHNLFLYPGVTMYMCINHTCCFRLNRQRSSTRHT